MTLDVEGRVGEALGPATEHGHVQSGERRERCREVFSSAPLLMSTPLLRVVTAHTLLLSFLVAGVWYERADAVTAFFASTTQRVGFFSGVNAVVGGVTSACDRAATRHER